MNELGDELKLKLQGCILGHVTRQQLVHRVRREYEQIADELQSVEGRELLSVATEAVVWPKKTTLCLPHFIPSPQPMTINEGHDETVDPSSEKSVYSTTAYPHSLKTATPKLPQSSTPASHYSSQRTTISPVHTGTPIDHPPQKASPEPPHTDTPLLCPPQRTNFEPPLTDTPTDHPSQRIASRPLHTDTPIDHPPHIEGGQCDVVFPELPESKEGLKELRAQLSMELLWIKQAIASRQNYLLYKKQLTSNTSE